MSFSMDDNTAMIIMVVVGLIASVVLAIVYRDEGSDHYE